MLQNASRPLLMDAISERVWHISSIHNGNMKSMDEYVYGKTHMDPAAGDNVQDEGRDWKLMIDPSIKGKTYSKVVRYGGLMEGPGVSLFLWPFWTFFKVSPFPAPPLSNIHYPQQLPVTLRDPRDQHSKKPKEIDIDVPKFKFDKWSVGAPPLKSIFIYGLNDNVNEDFLTSLCEPLGKVEQLKVQFHCQVTF